MEYTDVDVLLDCSRGLGNLQGLDGADNWDHAQDEEQGTCVCHHAQMKVGSEEDHDALRAGR